MTGLLASSAYTQVTPAPTSSSQPSASSDADAIVVTGTRIKRPDLESNSPLTTISSKEIKYEGAVNAEDILNRMPQFTADANENMSNGSDGTAKINLRNLGASRVLTLINGQRMMSSQNVDINFVPSALIDRIDVVSGGASAVYGSDAVAGVVNFVLKDHLDGFRMDMQTGISQHSNGDNYVRGLNTAEGFNNAPSNVLDGAKQDINAAYGKNFAEGRGNITVYGGYRHTDPVLESTRDVSNCALNQLDTDTVNGAGLYCGGSSSSQYGTFAPESGPSAGMGYLTNAKDGSKTWVPYDTSYAYNYSPSNYIQRSDQRYTAGSFGKFKISPAAEVYGSFMYMRDHTFSQVAPSALFLGSNFTLNCDNPLMSSQQATALCGSAAGTSAKIDTLIGYRLNNDFSRRDDLRHNDFRYTAGVRGDIGHGFSYDVNYLHSLVKYNETYQNNVDTVKAQRAIDAVNVNGTATCQSVVDGTDPSCVPIDIFKANGITSDQAQYLFADSNTAERDTMTVISANINGDLGTFGIKSPWANRGVSIALGAERRHESLQYTADAIAQEGGSVPTDGRVTVTEGYGEIEIPVLQDLPFAHALTLNGGARYSHYHNEQSSTDTSSNYNAKTFKAEVNWAPVADARLRASFNRAIRAPNISELFGPGGVGNVTTDDPCAGSNPQYSAQVCALSGVSSAQYGHIIQCPADTCSELYGGNAKLKPEKANTYTFGLVLTPRQIRNFSFSADYYHIKVKDYIGSLDPSLIISQCMTGNTYYCNLFHRNPTTGALFGSTVNDGYVEATTLNTGYLMTSGVDFNVDYTFGIGKFGKINANLVGTWLLHQKEQPQPGFASFECKGTFGYSCGEPNPTWHHAARLTWMIPGDASLSVSWRYLNKVKLSDTGESSVINSHIPTYNYFDLAGTIAINKQLELRAGVNNIADKDPPAIATNILTSFGNGNTFAGVYDVMGREMFVGASINF
ncbi:TonB-dependent receptor domain-containing protein [Sphingomonas abietis]|uniref:TonB-dependent receptor n=1 Tax=Sphingomonas abietis TaxID=3012344 RepID=A0ABY7NNY5_9SPHN|nr:TonB-dependent receptor [Sphingomonas abietis]WBO23254.1 TonB-dependent receptor [Sphingomonas abietis]